MSDKITDILVAELKSSKFTLKVDESTVRDSMILLHWYVRYVTKNDKILQESFGTNKIPLIIEVVCATDGTPAIIDLYHEFILHLKTVSPGIMSNHCIT